MSDVHEKQWTKLVQSTIKAHEQNERYSDVFIINFRGVDIEDPVKHVRWSFLRNSTGKS